MPLKDRNVTWYDKQRYIKWPYAKKLERLPVKEGWEKNTLFDCISISDGWEKKKIRFEMIWWEWKQHHKKGGVVKFI